MRTLTLRPYTNDLNDNNEFDNEYFSDCQDGRWLFYNNGQKVIVVDSFCGTIWYGDIKNLNWDPIFSELHYNTEFSKFLKEETYYTFLPQDLTSAWMFVEDKETLSNISVYQLNFDYKDGSVHAKKRVDLWTAEKANELCPAYSSFEHYVYKDFLTVSANSYLNGTMIFMVYKFEDLLSKSRPDLIYTGPIESIYELCPLLHNNCFYYFDFTLYLENNFCIQTFNELSKLLYFYDFSANTKGTIQLNNGAGDIQINKTAFDRIGNLKTFDAEWYNLHFFVCFTVRWGDQSFYNALAMLDLKTQQWQSIEMPACIVKTSNPLGMNVSQGILIFTNTHLPNPIELDIGDGTFIGFRNYEASKKKEPSYVYRMPVECPEKLSDLVYFSLWAMMKNSPMFNKL